LAESGDAILAWWKGSAEYKHAEGVPKGTSNASILATLNYSTIVWKTAKKVGFGVDGEWVVAWVCGVPSSPTADQRKANVPTTSCMKTAQAPATWSGTFDGCFNTAMLKKINTLREAHIVGTLEHDDENAAKLYKAVQASTDAKWKKPETTPTYSATRPADFEELWFSSEDIALL
jgi:hypothetical protein